MITFCRRILSLMAIALFTQAAAAQLSGEYELRLPDGSPAVRDLVATVDFVVRPGGGLIEYVYLDDPADEELPVQLEDETSEVMPLDPYGLSYAWINRRGTQGVIVMNPRTGRYESHVMTGPNAGRVTELHRVR